MLESWGMQVSDVCMRYGSQDSEFLQLQPVIRGLYYDLLAAAQPPPRLALNKLTDMAFD